MKRFVFLCFLFVLVSSSTDKVCRNPEGQAVDWFTIFFMPSSASPDKKIYYGYYDPTLPDIKYYEYFENNFPPTYITRYVSESGFSQNFNYFFWNDDKSLKEGIKIPCASSKAHAKGSLVYDEDDGAFLLHSLPRFPTRDSNNNIYNELPSNAGSFGQTFLCISVERQTAEKIAELLNCININVNKAVESDKVSQTPNPWVDGLIKNKMNYKCPIAHTIKIQSKGKETFTFYGKNYKNKIIPFDTTLREAYQDNIYVRSWTRPAIAPPLFDTYYLVNVLDVRFGPFQYGLNNEHSKWAITENKKVVCFSDLNHTESQKSRGGHIVCFRNNRLHTIMKKSILTTDKLQINAANSVQKSNQRKLVELLKSKLNNAE